MGFDFNPESISKSLDGLNRSQLLAALAGGFIAAFKSQTPGATLTAKLVNGFGGTAFATFTGQLVFWWIGLTHTGAAAGITFICGLVGMAITDSLLKAIAETRLGTMFNEKLRKMLGLDAEKKEPGNG